MNGTIIPPEKINRLKELVKEIEAIKYFEGAYALTFEEELKVEKHQNEINEIIKTL